jgi:hypothetical protein
MSQNTSREADQRNCAGGELKQREFRSFWTRERILEAKQSLPVVINQIPDELYVHGVRFGEMDKKWRWKEQDACADRLYRPCAFPFTITIFSSDVARPYSQDSSDPYTGELFSSLFSERPRGITRLLDVSGILSASALCVMASSELTPWMRTELSGEDPCLC